MTDEHPLLMVVPRDYRLSQPEAERLKMRLDEHRYRGGPIVFGFPCNIYRYVNGEWQVLPELKDDELEQLQITVEKHDD